MRNSCYMGRPVGQHERREMSLERDVPRKISDSVLSEGHMTCVLSWPGNERSKRHWFGGYDLNANKKEELG